MQDNYQSLVEDYVNSDITLDAILNQPKFIGDPFIAVLRALVDILEVSDKAKINQIFKDAEAFDKSVTNPIAKMILYVIWCHASMWKGLKRQTEIILEKAERLNPPDAPPILLSTIKTTVAYASGSGPAYLERLMIEYKKYGKTSSRFNRLLDNYVRMKCGAGLGVSIIKSENCIEQFKDKISSGKSIYFYRFLNDLGTCDLNSIQTYFHKIDQNDIEAKVWLALYDLFLKGELKIEIQAETTSHFAFFNSVLKVNYFLMNGSKEGALEELQKIKNGIWGHVSSNFLSYTQIRVELCNKNLEAAFQLLKLKLEKGDQHYMDDFFLARVELLKGNREKAHEYFRRCYQQCEYYLASNRLLIEIDLALEIIPRDLFYLAKNIDKSKAKDYAHINYDEIMNSEKLLGINRLIGESEAIKKIRANVMAYSATDLPLLITGETGVGKDIVAKALHEESPRKAEPFLAINCGAITESLLQSELFGHLAGSYTGAIGEHKGIFVEAGKGTVFLDEIGEISPAIQVALLRVLENNEVRPVGGSHQIAFQCRIIAATNADLADLVSKKVFREDLYYRLKRLELLVPPLRERKNDIIPLTNYFLKMFRHSNEAPTLSEDLQLALREFDWPGNIRQLKNEIEKMDLLQSRKSNYALADCEFFSNPSKTSQTQTTEDVDTIEEADFREDNVTAWRRLEKIKGLFAQFKDLTRKEIASKMHISLATATSDLKKLVAEKATSKKSNQAPRQGPIILS